MKKTFFFYSFLSCLFLANITCAQDYVRKISGNLDFLKNDSAFKVIYNYDNFKVGELTEKEYVTEKVKNMNGKKGHRGDDWYAGWINERTAIYQPAFDSTLNSLLEKANVSAHESNINARYTMMVKLTFMEPGFHAFTGFRGPRVGLPGQVSVEYVFFATNNPYVILARLSADEESKYGDQQNRIKRSYIRLGHYLGVYLLKYVYKIEP